MSEEQNINNTAPNLGAQGQVYGDPVTQVGHDYVAGDKTVHYHHPVSAPETERERRNRTVMLRKVYDFWVKGVLEKSLHKAALIDLGMEYQPDAVSYPWEMVVERPDATPQPLPPGTSIVSVFDVMGGDVMGGELLILGSPGSGKTTMLLELARTLIERAQESETHPIPVVFNLSSWAEKQPPLADWLVEELNARYDVSCKLGRAWVDNDQVLPLLDGLDEVRQEVRAKCVDAINIYRQEHGMIGMVVCSRVADYAALGAKLKLHGAIVLQPLTDNQVKNYFDSLNANTIAMQIAYNRLWCDAIERDDATEQQLLKTPLMLSIITLTYAEQTAGPPESLSIHDLFSTYVKKMLKRRGKNEQYTPKQIKHWLGWLANRMIENELTVFFLEQLQPNWLKDQRRLYFLLSMIMIILIVGFGIGLILTPITGIWIGGALGLGTGIGIASFFARYNEIYLVEKLSWSWQEVKNHFIKLLLISFSSSLVVGLLAGFIGGRFGGLFFQLGVALVSGLSVLILFLIRGIVYIAWFPDGIDERVKPNQGIRRSLVSSIFAFNMVFLVIRITIWFFVWLAATPFWGADDGFTIAALIGTILAFLSAIRVAFDKGFATIIQHYTLRFIFWRQGSMPLNYVRFLDYAAERILLRKVGGGYIFIHRLLLEYFAGLETEQPPASKDVAAP